MSKLLEVSSKPFKNPQGTFKQVIICHKIENDEDAKEYADHILQGVQILTPAQNGLYMFTQRLDKLPFDLAGGSVKNLPKRGK